MALNLGGSFQKQSQKSSFEQSQTGAQNTTGSATGSQVSTTLDPATIGILQDVIGTLVGTFSEGSADAEAIRALSGQLAQNTDPNAVNEMVNASVAEAQRQFSLNQGAQINQLQQLVGGKGNSFSQIIQNQGNVDLSTSLAKIIADIRMGASSQHATELASAMQGYAGAADASQAPLQQLLAAISTLTGARTETQTEESQIMEVLSSMLTKGSSKTTGSGFSLGASMGGK